MLQGLSALTPESALTLFDNLEFLIRIVLSALLGAVIGLERTRRAKEAGIRTHCIIAISSAAFMMLSKYAFLDLAGVVGLREADPARVAAQVVSGISFLGAGVIFKHNTSIKGLTTAAGMWATAAVGMAVGAGMYWLGIMATGALMVIQLILHRYPVGGDNLTAQVIAIRMHNDEKQRAAIEALLKTHRAIPEQSEVRVEGEQLYMRLELRLAQPISYEEVLQLLEENTGITEVSI